MNTELKNRLISLAEKYETADFLEKDPSKFMHQFSSREQQELAGFIAANLAFGNRVQILKHVQMILDETGTDLVKWVQNEQYKGFFNKGTRSFYRMFTHNDMILFFDGIHNILQKSGTLENHFKQSYQNNSTSYLFPLIQQEFDKTCKIIPQSPGTCAKRLNMFLRWMVRTNSPVDLGLWNWYPSEKLLMPLDTHVMQQSMELGILSPTKNGNTPAANIKTCLFLTEQMKEVFPSDPTKADFALFGLGVNS